MLELIFAIIIVVHGLIHVYGFVNEWFFSEAKEISWKRIMRFSPRVVKIAGIVWLVCAAIFLISAGGLLFGGDWWRVLAIVGSILSQILIILYLRSVWLGTIGNILVFLAVLWLK